MSNSAYKNETSKLQPVTGKKQKSLRRKAPRASDQPEIYISEEQHVEVARTLEAVKRGEMELIDGDKVLKEVFGLLK